MIWELFIHRVITPIPTDNIDQILLTIINTFNTNVTEYSQVKYLLQILSY